MALASGQTFAGYTIIRLLGSGAMGEVYLAQHPRLPRRDALKLLHHEWSADAEFGPGSTGKPISLRHSGTPTHSAASKPLLSGVGVCRPLYFS
jgi:serine/threonine protein kinase